MPCRNVLSLQRGQCEDGPSYGLVHKECLRTRRFWPTTSQPGPESSTWKERDRTVTRRKARPKETRAEAERQWRKVSGRRRGLVQKLSLKGKKAMTDASLSGCSHGPWPIWCLRKTGSGAENLHSLFSCGRLAREKPPVDFCVHTDATYAQTHTHTHNKHVEHFAERWPPSCGRAKTRQRSSESRPANGVRSQVPLWDRVTLYYVVLQLGCAT